MTDLPVRRSPVGRAAHTRPVPFRGGRMHPLAVPRDTSADEQQGISATVLADQKQQSKRQPR